MATTRRISMNDVLNFLDTREVSGLAHGPHRTLKDHLHGTMRILLHWRQPQDVVAAGLLHSIYSTDVYRQQLVPLSQAATVRRIAGASTERLVRLFCSMRRESFFENLSGHEARPWSHIRVACHRGPAHVNISREDAGKLLIVHMANVSEQTRRHDASPGIWVSAVSRWGVLARPLTTRIPPIFSSCTTQVSVENEKIAGERYRAGLDRLGESTRAARSEFSAAMKHLPWIAEPRIFLSFAALLDGRWSDAFLHATAARTSLQEWGTAWDKRFGFDEWGAIVNNFVVCSETGLVDHVKAQGMIHETARDASATWNERLKAVSMRPAAGMTQKLPPRFASYISEFRDGSRPKHTFYPGIRTQPSYSPAHFGLAKALSASYAKIRKEFERIPSHQGFQAEIEKIHRTGNWTIFPLYELGRRNDENCAKCPVTTSIVERHGATGSISSAVYFSILAPRTHIAAHTGSTNMRLRCHLGIEVPEGCRLRVGDETLTWQEGECLIFDDSFKHEVWNDSDERRVVLVVDLWHPELTREELRLIEGLNRFALAHAKDMSGYWKRNEQARSDHSMKTIRPPSSVRSRK